MTRFLLPPPPAISVEPGDPPEFSVIVPAYEAADTVADAVASALEQTHPPKEVIVCDDGSRDDPAAALAPFAERITLLRQENAGPSASRNTALAVASGDFVVGLDADDVLAPGNLAARAELLARRPDLDIVCTDGTVELDGRPLRQIFREDWTFETANQRAAILQRCFICFWAVRRVRLLEVGGFDEALSHAEDWDCWIRLILSGSRAGLVDEALGSYRLRHGSQSTQAAGLAEDRITTMEKAIMSNRLSDGEIAGLRGAIEEERFQGSLATVREALLGSRRDARRASRRLLLESGMPLHIRLRAALALIAPGLARRVIARRGRQTAAGVVLPAE